MGKAGVAIALMAMLTGVMPAGAAERPKDRQDRSGERDPGQKHGHDHGRRHHHDDDIDGLAIGALVIGGIAALIASGGKKQPAAAPVTVVDAAETDSEAAIAACTGAAEGEARRSFAVAQVGQVTAVEPAGPGFAIRGDVLVRDSYRQVAERRPFRCTVDGEAVREVAVDGPALASIVRP